MRNELENLIAVNTELVIQLEQQNALIDSINIANIEIMKKLGNTV